MKSFSFNKFDCKDLLSQKEDKGNTVFITDRIKYLEGIKSLLSDSRKFMQILTDGGNWINYIINLESKLKDSFKVLKKEEKNSRKDFDSICPVGTTPSISYDNPQVHLRNFDRFYQQ